MKRQSGMRGGKRFFTCVLATAMATFCLAGQCWAQGAGRDPIQRRNLLEAALIKLFFYPYNRLLDLNDVVQFGIAGSLGLGAEVGIGRNCSFGAYYTAVEKGIAFHGHQRPVEWGPTHSTLFAPPILSQAMGLLPGTAQQRRHGVKHGYATASFGPLRKASSDDDQLHFWRFDAESKLGRLLELEEGDEEARQVLMGEIDKALETDRETAIRAEAVAGIIHPYVALELYELLDFVGGVALIDLEDDDWEPVGGKSKSRKFGRGLSNIGSGFIEIPKNVLAVDKDYGGFAAWTYGTGRGVWRAFVRSVVVGPYEVLTFPVDTDPIIEPEFLFEPGTHETEWRVHY